MALTVCLCSATAGRSLDMHRFSLFSLFLQAAAAASLSDGGIFLSRTLAQKRLREQGTRLDMPPRYPIMCTSRNRTLLATLKFIVGKEPAIAEVGVFVGNYSTRLLDALTPSRLFLLDLWGCNRACGKGERIIGYRISIDVGYGKGQFQSYTP